ncbi:hypothetical protein SAMN05216390_10433 [Lachnospiraceae bacterium KH1T2]|nr:hypothetical protein SAMN05216390_10433 [Lachnospiraceae bacterium KH1T2]
MENILLNSNPREIRMAANRIGSTVSVPQIGMAYPEDIGLTNIVITGIASVNSKGEVLFNGCAENREHRVLDDVEIKPFTYDELIHRKIKFDII